MLRHLVFVGASTATLVVPAPTFAATSQRHSRGGESHTDEFCGAWDVGFGTKQTYKSGVMESA